MLGRPVQAGASAATRCSGRSAIAARRASGCGSAWTRDGRLTALEHRADRDDQQLRRLPRAGGQRLAQPLRQPGDRDHAHAACASTPARPGPMRAPGEASRLGRARMRDRRGGRGLRPRSARVPPAQLRRGRSGHRASRSRRRRCANATPQAAERFGWAGRPLAPRQMRDDAGRLVGWGMGTALFPAPMFRAEARAVLRADGTGLVETSAADMGQGAWTALAQIAADGLGLHIDRSSSAPAIPTIPTAASPAARAIPRPRAARSSAPAATRSPGSPSSPTGHPDSPLFGAGNAGVEARDGRLHHRDDASRSESYADILARAGLSEIEGTRHGRPRPGRRAQARAMFSHGAVFAEVKVDPDLGQVRVTRLVGAFAAGRIINPHLARSQLYGGMIWGVSFALHEEAMHDRAHRPADERRPRRLPRAGQRRRARRSRRCWSTRTTPTSTRSGSRASARSASPEPSAPSPMPSGMRPASAPAASRSGSRS